MMNIKPRKSKTTALKAGFLFGLLLVMPLAGCLGTDDVGGDTLVIAYEVRDDYATVDENPQALADYLSAVLGMKVELYTCLLYTSPSPRDATLTRMPSSA